jgi:hypothetical protein
VSGPLTQPDWSYSFLLQTVSPKYDDLSPEQTEPHMGHKREKPCGPKTSGTMPKGKTKGFVDGRLSDGCCFVVYSFACTPTFVQPQIFGTCGYYDTVSKDIAITYYKDNKTIWRDQCVQHARVSCKQQSLHMLLQQRLLCCCASVKYRALSSSASSSSSRYIQCSGLND